MSVFYVAFGVLLCTLPKLTVCPVMGESSYMPCWHTANLLTVTGCIILTLGIILRWSRGAGSRVAIHSLAAAAAYVSALMPSHFVSRCCAPEMMCQTVGYPIVYAMSIVIFLAAVTGLCKTLVELMCRVAEKEHSGFSRTE